MFEFNKRCEYCANHYRHPDAGCGSCVNGNNYIDSDFVPLPSFSLTGTIVIGNYDIKNVIFNPPATIVFWADGTKTVVKAHGEEFDPEKGLAMAISKKALGTGYYPEIKKWTKGYEEKAAAQALRNFEKSMRRVPEVMANAAEKVEADSKGDDSDSADLIQRRANVIRDNLGCAFFYTLPCNNSDDVCQKESAGDE